MVHKKIDRSKRSDFEVRKKMDAKLERQSRDRRAIKKNDMKKEEYSSDSTELDLLVKATPSPIPIKAVSPPKKETDAAVVTSKISADKDTDIRKTVSTKNDPKKQENVYSPQDETYLCFDKGLDNNRSSATRTEKGFSCLIHSLEESCEPHQIHPRELFPEPPDEKIPGKKVAFSSDNTVRFFSRSKEELMQLRRRKKKIRGNAGVNDANDDSFEEQPFLRYFEEKLKTTEDFVKSIEDSVQSSFGVVSGFFQPEKTVCACQAPTSFTSALEKEEIPDDITPSNKSLADSLLPEDDDENSLKADEPKGESFQDDPSNILAKNASNTSSNSNNSGISGLWFAVPYKPPSHDASFDFIQPADPKGSPVMNASLLINPKERLDDSPLLNSTNGKITSPISSLSLDRKKEVVEAAKRWAASQKDFFNSAHQQLGVPAEATETAAETFTSSSPEDVRDLDEHTISSSSMSPDGRKEVLDSAKRWADAQKDFFESAHQQMGIIAKDTDKLAKTSRSSSPEDGPDLDESRNSSLAPPSLSLEGGPDLDESRNWTETADKSDEWLLAEFGPDLDESRELEHQDPDLNLSVQWESFEHEAFTATKVTQKTAVENADWATFPSPMADLPALSQDAPDMDEAKEWRAFQEERKEENPNMTIRARLQAAPREEWKQRIANFNRSRGQENVSKRDAPSDKKASHETVVPNTREHEKHTTRVKEMARAIELHRAKEVARIPIVPRASPSNASVVSSLTPRSSMWAEDGKENTAELSELQFPVLDCECSRENAQPSPLSVTLL